MHPCNALNGASLFVISTVAAYLLGGGRAAGGGGAAGLLAG